MKSGTRRLGFALAAVITLLGLWACSTSIVAPTEAPAETSQCSSEDIRALTSNEVIFERMGEQANGITTFTVTAQFGPFTGISRRTIEGTSAEPIDMIGGLPALREMEHEALDILNQQIMRGALAIDTLRPVDCIDSKG